MGMMMMAAGMTIQGQLPAAIMLYFKYRNRWYENYRLATIDYLFLICFAIKTTTLRVATILILSYCRQASVSGFASA